jgi:transcriptional regulator with XRE-family HTH domain
MTDDRAETYAEYAAIEVTPNPDDLLENPQRRERFEETSAALEAADLVRAMREQAASKTGRRGISQTELAARTGLSQPRISQIEKGIGRDGISYALLRRIALACGIELGSTLRDALTADRPVRESAEVGAAFEQTLHALMDGMEKAAKVYPIKVSVSLEKARQQAEAMLALNQGNLNALTTASRIYAKGLRDISRHLTISNPARKR